MSDPKLLEILKNAFPDVQPTVLERLIEFHQEEFTVPFVCHFREVHINQLAGETVRNVYYTINDYQEFERKRENILNNLKERDLLTEELEAQIKGAGDRLHLDELYLPFKPRRKNKAASAREKGLGEFAEKLLAQDGLDQPIADLAKEFVSEEKELPDAEAVLKDTSFIIADIMNTNSSTRAYLRQHYFSKAVIHTRVAPGREQRRSKYMDYYDFREEVATIPSHRVLAIRRGEKEGFLRTTYEVDSSGAMEYLKGLHLKTSQEDLRKYLEETLEDAFHRLIIPSFETEIRGRLKSHADSEAITIFCHNLKQLLLAPPAPDTVVMAIDSSYHSGCMAVVVNGDGKLKHQQELAPQYNRADDPTKAAIVKLLGDHGVQAIVVAENNTSRNLHVYLRRLIRDTPSLSIQVTLIDETASKVYGNSEFGQNEFPNLEAEVRKCISLARRYQDPLAELVKIDPKHIGVGQYQHDVDQGLLKRNLHDVVESCVNSVGADLNTASKSILRYISGLNDQLADEIMRYRLTKKRFTSRPHLLDVDGIDVKIFRQAAGFLLVKDSPYPLDDTFVHPEHYELVAEIAKSLGMEVKDLLGHREVLEDFDISHLANERITEDEIKEVVLELMAPGRDPRTDIKAVQFREDVCEITDLQEGMILEGKITNVTNFGVFVDIGVHQDGLVHVSELSHEYIKDPTELVGVGDVVTAKVIGVDMERRRISLSMKQAEEQAAPVQVEEERRESRPDSGEGRRSSRPRKSSRQSRFSEEELTFGEDISLDDQVGKSKKKKKKKKKSAPTKTTSTLEKAPEGPTNFDSEDDFRSAIEKLKSKLEG